jgi:uncharacterized protein (TIGR00369 family)
MSIDEHYRRLERMYHSAPITELYDTRLEVGQGEATVTMPVREELFHAAGALHGSGLFRAMDDAAFFAANSVVKDTFVLTVSFSLHFTRPVTGGTLTARGRLVHHSRNLLVAEAEVVDTQGKKVAMGTGTFLPRGPKLTAAIGYA